MHRLILLSSTYQQSSAVNEDAAEGGSEQAAVAFPAPAPGRRSDSRFARSRSRGLLNRKMGGPSVFPTCRGQPVAARRLEGYETEETEPAQHLYLRAAQCALPDAGSLRYAGHARILRAPQSDHHGAAGAVAAERQSDAEWAQAFAGAGCERRIRRIERAIELAYRLALAEPMVREGHGPTSWRNRSGHRGTARRREAGTADVCPAAYEQAQAAAFVDLCQMLLNSNEFVYRN